MNTVKLLVDTCKNPSLLSLLMANDLVTCDVPVKIAEFNPGHK